MNRKAQDWVRRYGARSICANLEPKDLCVTDGAVYRWLSGRAKPSYERCKALVELAKKDVKFGGKSEHLTVEDFRAPHEGGGSDG